MNKFDLKMITFALCMCLFVGFGSATYRKNNVIMAETKVPLSSGYVDFDELTSDSVIEKGQELTVYSYNEDDYTCESMTVTLSQNGKVYQTVTSEEKHFTGEEQDGHPIWDGLYATFKVSNDAVYGTRTTISIKTTIKDSNGITTDLYDSISVETGKSNDTPDKNGGIFQIKLSGSQNSSGSYSIYSPFTIEVVSNSAFHQMHVSILDSGGAECFTRSPYSKSLVIDDLDTYIKGHNLSSCKIKVIYVRDDSQNFNYENYVTVNFVDDKPKVETTEGTFTIDGDRGARNILADENISASYRAHSGESIESLKLQLVNEDSGKVIQEFENKVSASNSGLTSLDVSFAVDEENEIENVKLVCIAKVNGNTYKKEVTGCSLNVGRNPGTIKVQRSPDTKQIKVGTILKLNTSIQGNGKLTKVTFEAKKNGQSYYLDTKTLNTSQFEYAYTTTSKDIGDVTYSLTAEGIFDGKTLDPAVKEYALEIVGEQKVDFNSNLFNLLSPIEAMYDGSFTPFAEVTFQGEGYLTNFDYKITKKGSSKTVIGESLKTGNFKTYKQDLTEVSNYFKKNKSELGEYEITLKATSNTGDAFESKNTFRILSDEQYKAITTAHPGFIFTKKDVTKGTVISFTSTRGSNLLKQLKYTLLNSRAEVLDEGVIKAKSSQGDEKIEGSTRVDFKDKNETEYIYLNLETLDTEGEVWGESYRYFVTDANEVEIDFTLDPKASTLMQGILPGNKTLECPSSLSFNFDDGSKKVKAELVDVKTNKVVLTNSTGTGTFRLSNEGTFTLRILKDGKSIKEKTYYVLEKGRTVDDNADKKLLVDIWSSRVVDVYSKENVTDISVYYFNNTDSDIKDATIELTKPDSLKLYSVSSGYYLKDSNTIQVGNIPKGYLGFIKVKFDISKFKEEDFNKEYSIKADIFDGNSKAGSSETRLYVYSQGHEFDEEAYLTGYPDGSIKPGNPITRGEVSAIFQRAFDLDELNEPLHFTDVKTSQWAYPYIKACAQNGIVNGYKDGSFKPSNNITVNELATMIFRVLKMDEGSSLVVRNDYETKDTWEKPYINGLEKLNMLSGLETKDTSQKATRGDVIHLVNRVRYIIPASNLPYKFTDKSKSERYNGDISLASTTGKFVREKDGKVNIK